MWPAWPPPSGCSAGGPGGWSPGQPGVWPGGQPGVWPGVWPAVWPVRGDAAVAAAHRHRPEVVAARHEELYGAAIERSRSRAVRGG